jgi:hypothetical protein
MQLEDIGFPELLETIKTVNSKDKTMKLGDCIQFELSDLMQKINEYNKDGEITIKLRVNVEEKNELNLIADISSKKPKGSIKQNVFYRDTKGKLYLDDPNQLKLIDSRTVRELHAKGAQVE